MKSAAFPWFAQLCFVLGLLYTLGFAIPKDVDKKDRVIEKSLSDEEHYSEGEHNPNYDHEAFLGEEAKTFNQLTPQESVERLKKIVDKMDKDKDGFVTHKELKEWIQYTQKRYILDDVDRQWATHNPSQKELLTWQDYMNITYGFMKDMDEKDLENDANGETYKSMIERDQRRWKAADQDNDASLSKEEFVDFLHPEETARMHHIVVEETLDDIDKDKDGKISLEEYIGDMYTGGGDDDDDEDPDWVKNEKNQFHDFRDKNKDGFLDTEEIREWILPPDYDHSEAESKHLIYEADTNGDKKLTKEEVVEKYDLFVGSQATDFGEGLVRHDEF